MLPYVGHTPYNYFELMIAQPIYIITDKKIWLGNKDNKKFICSEFVAFVYNHFNSNIFNNGPIIYSIVLIFIDKS